MRFPDDVPTLSDGVVVLRAHRLEDVDDMVQMCTDPMMQRWTNTPRDYTREHAIGFATEVMRVGWEEKQHRGWAIEAVDDDGKARFAGNLDVRGVPIANIGFALHPWARGRGLMTRAIRLATRWAFEQGDVEIVHWRSHVGNVDSLRTAWAAGFELHGTTPGLLHERGLVLNAWTGSLRPGTDGKPRTTWWAGAVLEGDRARLRPLQEQDLPRIVEACSDPVTQYWLADLPADYSEQHARAHLDGCRWQQATGTAMTWCVAGPASDELLGEISVMGMQPDNLARGEIGYWMHPKSRGCGAMTEAVRLVVAHALLPTTDGGMGRTRLSLHAADGNAPSNAVARAAGFSRVGTQRRAEPLGDGSYADLHVYELLA